MNLNNLILVALLFYVPFHFSKKTYTLFFHLLYSFFGIYMILTMDFINPLYNHKLLVGLGLLIPQINFIIGYTIQSIQTLKMMTTNSYYFFITIYYKIIRFINWIKSTAKMIEIFFTTFSFKKEDYQEHDQNSQQNYKQEQKHQKFYEEQSYKTYEEPKAEPKQKYEEHGEFAQFYSESAYTVLGVSADDDYKTIKKAYRKLVREFHPDLNHDKIQLATEITQNINDAWEKVEKWKK